MILMTNDFEGFAIGTVGKALQGKFDAVEVGRAQSLECVMDPADSFKKACKVNLKSTDPQVYGGVRCEFVENVANNPAFQWTRVDYIFPANYQVDKSEEIISQAHDKYAKDPNRSASPVVAIEIYPKNGKNWLRAVIRSSTKDYITNPETKTETRIDIMELPLGIPCSIIYNSNYNADPNVGYLKVWVNPANGNATPNLSYAGGTNYVQGLPPYHKVGLYKWKWNSAGGSNLTERTFYLRTVQYGDQASVLADFIDGTPVPVNKPPIVTVLDASTNQPVISLTPSQALDPDGTITKYAWKQLSGPNQATLSGVDSKTLMAANLVNGDYVFSLTVTDNQGATATDETTVSVTLPPPPKKVVAQLFEDGTWEKVD